MLDTASLNRLILDAFVGKTTWFEASSRYPLDEFIQAFHRTRALMRKTLNDITDAQAAYTADLNPAWSLSETVTHLVYSQNFYYNQLLEITTTELPHIIEAAKGFGEGAQRCIPADTLRTTLDQATILITEAIEKTRVNNDPANIKTTPFFGKVNYQTWILLLLAHETDHVRQAIIMRRQARTMIPGDVPPEQS